MFAVMFVIFVGVVVMMFAVAVVLVAVMVCVNVLTVSQSEVKLKALVGARLAAEMIDIHSASCHPKHCNE